MGDAPEDVGKAINFAGVPDTYDPDQITFSIQEALDQVTGHLEAPVTPVAPVTVGLRYPSYTTVRRLTVTAAIAGTYGSSPDPRVGQVVIQDGSGLAADGQAERFRIETGVTLNPLARAPVKGNLWAIQNAPPLVPFTQAVPARLTFGLLVPKIPHGLKRIPERVTLRTSAGPTGPTGQLVKTLGNATHYAAGKHVRCDIDFIPVFGQKAEDIEWRLKHLVSFTSGLFGSDDLGGAIVDTSTYQNPAIRRQTAIDMVTTDQHFGGLLLATAWGWATSAGGVGIAEPGPPITMGAEMSLVGLRNSVNDVDDGMITVAIPEIGKSLFALPVLVANLDAYLSTGLRLVLTSGTVDFVLE